MSRPHPALLDVAAGRTPPLVDDVEWLVRSATEHGMAGLLWSAWAGRPKAERCWADLAMGNVRRQVAQARIWKALAAISGRLDALGICIATAKGVTAEARWYEPGQRPCVDLDLLVGPDDVARAREILVCLDRANHYLPQIDRLVVRGLLQSVDLVVEGVNVDLHFDIFKLGVPCRQRDLLWERTLPFALPGGGEVRVLDPELALVEFLLHLNKDRFRYLKGFADVARILQREELDWAFIERFCKVEGMHTPVWLALETVSETLGLASPVGERPRGWRTGMWDVVWRPSVRLQGVEAVERYRHRQHLLGLLAPRRAHEAVWLWARRFVFPPRIFLEDWYPTLRGPYLWRTARGRSGHILGRLRRTLARARRHGRGRLAGSADRPPPR